MGRIADLWKRVDRLDRRIAGLPARDDNPPAAISMVDWAKLFRPGQTVNYAGNSLQAFQLGGGGSPGSAYYSSNSVVFACAMVRMLLFSEARFQFQHMRGGRPGDL